MVEHLYCKDKGRPAVDPVVLVKIVLSLHLFGIPSLRKTVEEAILNLAYRRFRRNATLNESDFRSPSL